LWLQLGPVLPEPTPAPKQKPRPVRFGLTNHEARAGYSYDAYNDPDVIVLNRIRG
jgi:hypothetical protein